MITFNKEDFSKMMYNPYPLGENIDIAEYFGLNIYDEFKNSYKDINYKNKVIRYMMFMYDRNSPLNKIIDLKTRKIEALKLAGFKSEEINSKLLNDKIIRLINFSDNIFTNMVMRYLRLHKDNLFMYIYTVQERFYKECEKVIAGNDTDTKLSETLKYLKEAIKDIEGSITEYFNGEYNKQLHTQLSNFIEEEIINLRPENIAKMINEGEVPISYEEIKSKKKKV